MRINQRMFNQVNQGLMQDEIKQLKCIKYSSDQ